MPDAFELLRANPILGSGSHAALAAAAKRCEVRVYSIGSTVVRTNMPQREVLALAEGSLELSRRNRTRGTRMLQGLLGAPAIFGDAERYSGSPVWHDTARAVAPVTLVAIPNRVFDQLVERDGAIAAGLYRDACARHMLVIDLLQIFALQDLNHKILRLLSRAAERSDVSSDAPRAPFSPTHLARALGVSAKTITRHVQELERKGLVRREGRSIVLLVGDLFFGGDLGTHGLGASWELPEG